ncbi:MAG: hypothetical protein ACRYG5_08925 [Janthinobacterium lividum]
MLLIVLAYLGGALTILSPCILPVLPFVFSRADQPFVRSGLPLLAGMALTFAVVATLYQLIRQVGPVTTHTFAIEFLDPRVEAYAFTFG